MQKKLIKSEHGPSQGLTRLVSPQSGAAVRKITPGLFYAKSDHELATKVEKNSPRFPMVTYTLSDDRRFRHYNFWTTTELLKTVIRADCSIGRKIKSGTVQMGFFY
jgi:hypothetical protein